MPLFTIFCLALFLAMIPLGALLERRFQRLSWQTKDRLGMAYAGLGIVASVLVGLGIQWPVAVIAGITGLIMGIPLAEIVRDATGHQQELRCPVIE